jgi:hypothetical protein
LQKGYVAVGVGLCDLNNNKNDFFFICGFEYGRRRKMKRLANNN